MRFAALVAVMFVWVPSVSADGCKYALSGRFVPEREQRAMVEWADGVETLYVAARTDPTSEGTVWVVPVRAAAVAVRADPVEEFPAVVYYETLKWRAEQQLKDWVAVAALLDSGGLCCFGIAGGCDDRKAAKSAEEVSRVERLGMVVTVVNAGSRAGLERYLSAQGVNRSAADLSSLEPYVRDSGYAFVCGWVANRGEPVEAAALRVVFPSPSFWFPLRPTRAYANQVETVVYARGFVKPADGCDLPGLRCEYIFAQVESRGLRQAFAADQPGARSREPTASSLEEMTRVTLAPDPQKWDRDLELVPGTTGVGTVSLAVTGWVARVPLVWSALIGAALGLAMPVLAVPRAERQSGDCLLGALTGAAIALSLWAALAVFCLWRWNRVRGGPRRLARFLVLPALALAHFGVVLAACYGLSEWIRTAG
jgi:hypothetical protein